MAKCDFLRTFAPFSLEGLAQSGGSHLQLVVLFVTAQMVLDVAAQIRAVVHPHAIGVVYFYDDAIVGANLNIYEEVFLPRKPFLN